MEQAVRSLLPEFDEAMAKLADGHQRLHAIKKRIEDALERAKADSNPPPPSDAARADTEPPK